MNASIPRDETFSLLSPLTFTPDAPFPTEGLSANIGTVVDCEYATAAEDVPVPTLEKW